MGGVRGSAGALGRSLVNWRGFQYNWISERKQQGG